MKNLLERRPSLAELTGISDTRLQCFVDHLRTYLVGSTTLGNSTTRASNTAAEVVQSSQSPFLASKPSRIRSCSIQGSLSPRPSSFKEAMPRNLASLRNVVRDKLRRRVEGGRHSCVETSEKHHPTPSPSTSEPSTSSMLQEKSKLPESTCVFPSLSGLEPGLVSPSSAPQFPPIASTLFSPYYCWCPPVVSTLQYTVAPPHLIPASTAETFTLPPLSSLLATSGSVSRSFLTPKPSPNLSEIPPFLPLSMPVSQQIPMFTPLMCDPIVHIPVIDICSSSCQAYLVSAGPQETDSEKGARDTLRLLISGSSQFPSVVASTDGTGGSRGFYDVKAIANSIAAMSLVSVTPGVVRRCIDQGDLVDLLEDSGGTCSNDDGPSEGSTE